MANEITVSEDIRRLAKTFESMVAAADMLEEIGKNKQTAAECQAAAKAAQQELASAKAEVDLAKVEVKKHKDAAAEVLADAKAKADDLLADAARQREAITAAAAVQADEIRAGALNGLASKVKALEGEVVEKLAEKGALEAELAGMRKEHAEMEAQCDDIEKKLNAAKNKLRALIEG